MKILIAENDPVSRRMLEVLCRSWGFEVIAVQDGVAACKALETENAPPLAILDWMMPGMDGIEVTRKTRAKNSLKPIYIILLTARGDKKDVIEGLWADADDYITKPFNHQELRARIHTGERVVGLQMALAERIAELESALSRVKRLQGLLPICSYCKRIRNDRNYWQQVETYIAENTEAEFTHGICPNCYESIIKPELEMTRPD